MSNDAKTRRHRTTAERIADLQAEIERQKRKVADRERKAALKRELPPSIKRIPRLAKSLQEFSALATADGRQDVANSVSMFLAGLQRVYQEEQSRRTEPEPVDDDAAEAAAEEQVEVTPSPRRSKAPVDDAERRFDERLRSVAKEQVREPSEWER